jgi:hypothetical protein
VSSLKLFIIYKGKRDAMKIRTNVKAGAIASNHNEKMASNNSNSIELKESMGKKLLLSKETVRELGDSEPKVATGVPLCPPMYSDRARAKK